LSDVYRPTGSEAIDSDRIFAQVYTPECAKAVSEFTATPDLVGLAPNHPHDHSGVLNRLLRWFFGVKTALMLSKILMRLFVAQNCRNS